MRAGQLVVFDVRAGRVVANLDGVPTVTGVLAVQAEHRAYAYAPVAELLLGTSLRKARARFTSAA